MKMNLSELRTTVQFAKERGVSRQWVHYLIQQDRLKAILVGDRWLISSDAVIMSRKSQRIAEENSDFLL